MELKTISQRTFEKLAIVREIAEQATVPTPFLCVHEREVLDALNYFSTYLPGVNVHYAVKANPDRRVLKLLAREGISFDVASAHEIDTLRELGVDGGRMLLANPMKDGRTLDALVRGKVKGYTFDNVSELHKLAAHLKGVEHSPYSLLRIKTDVANDGLNLEHKFGCDLAEATDLILEANRLGLSPRGFSFHVGPQTLTSERYHIGIKRCMELAAEIERLHGITLDIIDIGGGFPDIKFAKENGVSVDVLFYEIGYACKEALKDGFSVIAEPGRFLVNAAGTLAARVIGVSERGGKRWVFLDDGVYGSYSNTMYEKYKYDFHVLSGDYRKMRKDAESTVLAGPTCDCLDVISQGVELPKDIKVGDIIVATDIGAYSIAAATRFNGFSGAEVVLDQLEREHTPKREMNLDNVVVLKPGLVAAAS